MLSNLFNNIKRKTVRFKKLKNQFQILVGSKIENVIPVTV